MKRRHRYAGQILLLPMLAVLIAFALAWFYSRLDAQRLLLSRERQTAATLLQARTALIAYAATYLDNAEHQGEVFGFLPCPDRNGDGIADLVCGTTGAPAIGLLPYRTLGLPQLFDAEGNCLWYAVSGVFKNNPKTRPLNWDARSDFQISGWTLPEDADGGPAAIIIAPGLASIARTNPDSVCHSDVTPAQQAAYLESVDASGKVFVPGRTGTANNDRLAWFTGREVFTALQQRHDFADFLNQGIAVIHTAAEQAAGTWLATANQGLPLASPFPLNSFARNFYDHWRDHFRYLTCPAGSACYEVNGLACNGVLLFAGQADPLTNQTGSPRAMDRRASSNYFEPSPGGLALVRGTQNSVTGAAEMVDATAWSRDVIRCLRW